MEKKIRLSVVDSVDFYAEILQTNLIENCRRAAGNS